jgi:hypothetical protein
MSCTAISDSTLRSISIHALAVGHAALTSSGINTGNPQLTEDTLFGTAVTVSILPSFHDRFFSDPENITAATTETFCKGQNFFVAGASRYTTFDARHVITPCSSLIKYHGLEASAPYDPYRSHEQQLNHAIGVYF